MHFRPMKAISAIWLLASTLCAEAQSGPGDQVAGRALAERLCSNCHAVSPDSPNTLRGDIPSFMTIARMPNKTPERLAGAIILPHPAMPGVALTRTELRDIIGYIMSLRP